MRNLGKQRNAIDWLLVLTDWCDINLYCDREMLKEADGQPQARDAGSIPVTSPTNSRKCKVFS
jgi:hypothetical protein